MSHRAPPNRAVTAVLVTRAMALTIAALVCLACAAKTEKLGGETSWLTACTNDSDCEGTTCLCGACTSACTRDNDCDGNGDAVCAPSDGAALAAQCGESRPSICLPACTRDRDCSSDQRCVSGGCVLGGTAPEALDIIVVPDADGNLPQDLWIGCQNGPEFQVSDLDAITPLAESDPGGVAEAIEPFLSSGEGQFWPQEDWLILRQTSAEILLVHRDDEGVAFMTVRRVDGEWMWSGSRSGGTCPLHYLTPEGLNAVDWRLDRGSPPDASTTSLAILVTERECVSGQALGDRLRGPQVVMTEDAVRLAFAAEPPPGDAFDCPSNPETPVTVELSEPLGEREVIEGMAIGIDLEDYLP